ncbi:MAG: glycosyltransferase, partial [Actinomycetota bacterium]|nr:glycosyltransferase [Actinomycetota bacterium]
MSTRRLRVVYVDHSAQLSGGQLALARLLGAMDGVERHVVLAEDGPLVSRLRDCGAAVEVLPMSGRIRNLRRDKVDATTLVGPHAVASAAYAIRLARRIRQIRPDIVHTNSLKSALYGGLAAKLARLPLVVGLHDRIADD